MIWDHSILVPQTGDNDKPVETIQSEWDIDMKTGRITHNDPLHITPQERSAYAWKREYAGEEEDAFEWARHVRRECSSEERK
jgi:hypothetical protein